MAAYLREVTLKAGTAVKHLASQKIASPVGIETLGSKNEAIDDTADLRDRLSNAERKGMLEERVSELEAENKFLKEENAMLRHKLGRLLVDQRSEALGRSEIRTINERVRSASRIAKVVADFQSETRILELESKLEQQEERINSFLINNSKLLFAASSSSIAQEAQEVMRILQQLEEPPSKNLEYKVEESALENLRKKGKDINDEIDRISASLTTSAELETPSKADLDKAREQITKSYGRNLLQFLDAASMENQLHALRIGFQAVLARETFRLMNYWDYSKNQNNQALSNVFLESRTKVSPLTLGRWKATVRSSVRDNAAYKRKLVEVVSSQLNHVATCMGWSFRRSRASTRQLKERIGRYADVTLSVKKEVDNFVSAYVYTPRVKKGASSRQSWMEVTNISPGDKPAKTGKSRFCAMSLGFDYKHYFPQEISSTALKTKVFVVKDLRTEKRTEKDESTLGIRPIERRIASKPVSYPNPIPIEDDEDDEEGGFY